jgi:hypothetical protein
MARAQNERLQDEEVEGALQQGNAVVAVLLGSHSTQIFTFSGRMSTQTAIPIQSEPLSLDLLKAQLAFLSAAFVRDRPFQAATNPSVVE